MLTNAKRNGFFSLLHIFFSHMNYVITLSIYYIDTIGRDLRGEIVTQDSDIVIRMGYLSI